MSKTSVYQTCDKIK